MLERHEVLPSGRKADRDDDVREAQVQPRRNLPMPLVRELIPTLD